MNLCKVRGGISKPANRAAYRAQHKEELKSTISDKVQIDSIDDADAARALMLLCAEFEKKTSEEGDTMPGLAGLQTDSKRKIAEHCCPRCSTVISTRPSSGTAGVPVSPVNVTAPFQWGLPCMAAKLIPNQNQTSLTSFDGKNITSTKEPPSINSRLPPLHPHASGSTQQRKHNAEEVMKRVETREEITNQRLIAGLVQAALFRTYSEQIAA